MELLRVEKAEKNFGGVVAVKDFDLTVNENQIVGIIGPNGAGKTTIFNLISKIYELDGGRIKFKGRDVTHYSPEQMAVEGVARTFQNIRLFSGLNVLDNVKAACDYKPRYSLLEAVMFLPRRRRGEKKIEEEAMECLRISELEHLAYEQPGNLPYGMQRKLEISRALALQPKILMLDEPAAGLNPQEVFDLIDFLRRMKQKLQLSLIIIEHRMDVIMELCEIIYVQDFGKTIAIGTPEQIQTDPVVLSAYLGEETGDAED